MDFQDVLANRHSIRAFSQRPLATDTITQIVQDAGTTPSWANDQIWQVVVATGDHLAQIKRAHLAARQSGRFESSEFPALHRDAMAEQGRSNVSRWSTDLQTFLGLQSDQMTTASAHLFSAPAIAYLLMPAKSSLWTAYDLGAFGQTLMLAATARGVASMPAAEFVAEPKQLHAILNVSPNYQFGMGIGLGYPDEQAKINQFRSERMPLDRYLTLTN